MPFYDPKKMKRALAGPTYSTSEGVWATGERMLFGIIDKPAGTGSPPSATDRRWVLRSFSLR